MFDHDATHRLTIDHDWRKNRGHGPIALGQQIPGAGGLTGQSALAGRGGQASGALGGRCLQIAGAQYHLVKAIQPGGGIADVSLRRRADFTVSGQFPALAVAYPEQKSRPVIGREGGSQLG